MNDAHRRLIQGVILGGFIGAGVMFVMFWRILTTASNAGAMVDGVFKPYSADPSRHIMLGGGLILIIAGFVFLAVTWRSLGGRGS
jgi:glycerol uptake facilitator-like aquaporin